jgi:hypothetical protein
MALVSLAPATPAEDLSAYGTPVETLGSVTRLSASIRFDAVDAPLPATFLVLVVPGHVVIAV